MIVRDKKLRILLHGPTSPAFRYGPPGTAPIEFARFAEVDLAARAVTIPGGAWYVESITALACAILGMMEADSPSPR